MTRGLNKVQIIGHLGRDPELRSAASGSPVVSFTVAVNRGRRDGSGQVVEETEWFRVVLWDRLAETADRYLRKGSLVFIEGRLQSRKYTDRDGIERVAVEVIGGEMMMFPESRQGRDGDEAREDQTPPPAEGATKPVAVLASPRPPAPSRRGGPAARPAAHTAFPDRDIDDVPFD
jgi:single-strand DNA-binding protein